MTRMVFRTLFVATGPPESVRASIALHGDIVAAVVARDGHAAEAAMRALVEDFARVLERTLAARSMPTVSRRRCRG